MKNKLFAGIIVFILLLGAAATAQAEEDMARWDQENFSVTIDPAAADDVPDILAILYYQKAVELLKAYRKDDQLKNLYSALNAEGKAIDLNPDKAIYWSVLGDIHSEMAKLDILGAKGFAIEAYQQALELNPDDAATMVILGVWFARMSEYAEALDYFEGAFEKDPSLMSSNAVQWMNLCYLAGAQTKRGTLFYEKFIAANPEYRHLRVYQAVLYDAHFDRTSAIKELYEVIGDEKTDPKTKKAASKLLKEIQAKEAQA